MHLFLKVLSIIFLCVLLITSALKLLEIIYHAFFPKYGKEKCFGFVSKIASYLLAKYYSLKDIFSSNSNNVNLKIKPFNYQFLNWPITYFFNLILPDGYARKLFRFRYYVVAFIIIIIFSPDQTIIIICMAMLFFYSCIEVVRINVDIYSAFRGYSKERKHSEFDNYTVLSDNYDEKPQSFLKVFIFLTLVIIFSYATIYFGLDKITEKPMFHGITYGVNSFFDYVYFSTITICTVGFGDIYPLEGSIIARILVALQVFTGFLLIIVLVNSKSLITEIKNKKNT